MAYQVLSTKLFSPPRKHGLIQRPHLIKELGNGLREGKHVTLVSAPAGFGKTTIINEWINSIEPPRPYGWVSLDDGDNDPVRFLIYLVSAIQKVNENIGRSVLTTLHSLQSPILADLIEALINEISRETTPFLVVLDDYHLVKKIEVHSLVQLLLKRQPERLHLVIITREDPPLPLPGLRVQGLITEIREKDLRFAPPEAQAFLVKTMGLDLSPDEVGKLEERTEGWPAGMQLAALALEDFSDAEERRAFIEAFAGSNRLIADYLVSEVLLRQPDATRQFLLFSSILERFSAELCEKVIFDSPGVSHSQPILESLEQANMFLIPLDDQRLWYRYHHLFSEMLYHSLRRSSPEQIPTLHRRASVWYKNHGLIPEAVKHSLAYASISGDWDFARTLLDQFCMGILVRGQINQVIEWCHPFPQAYLETAPELCIYYAWSLVLTFRTDFLEAVEEKLKLAEQAIESISPSTQACVGEEGACVPLREWITGQVYAIRSQVLLGEFLTSVDPLEEIALSFKGLELLPEGEKITRAICKINLAHAQAMQNNLAEARQAFDEALPFMLEAQNYLGSVTCIFYLSRLAYYQGQLDHAEALCCQWKEKITDLAGLLPKDAWNLPATRGLDIVLGLLLLEHNQVDQAEHLLVQALGLLGWASWMELHGFIILAHLRHLRGNARGVKETLQRMAHLGPQHAACSEALELLFATRDSPGDPQVRLRAKSWSERFVPHLGARLALGIGPYHSDAEYFCNLTWSRIQIALGDFKNAATFIEPALKSAMDHNLPYRVVELSIEQALINQGLGKPGDSLRALERALDIGEQCGYLRAFDHSAQLDRLLTQAARLNHHAHYVKFILSSSLRPHHGEKINSLASPTGKDHPGLIEPLSEREIEVLKLLACGMSRADAAQRLVLSPFTLKAHIQNIYGKLDVHNRVEAINKAQHLGII